MYIYRKKYLHIRYIIYKCQTHPPLFINFILFPAMMSIHSKFSRKLGEYLVEGMQNFRITLKNLCQGMAVLRLGTVNMSHGMASEFKFD